MKCRKCNRPLKSPKAIANGIGPVCARKEQAEAKTTENHDMIIRPWDGSAPLWAKRLNPGSGTTSQIETNIPFVHREKSPTGYNWGYAGSGPACLAQNVLEAIFPKNSAVSRLYQLFKQEWIEGCKMDMIVFEPLGLLNWIGDKTAELTSEFYEK